MKQRTISAIILLVVLISALAISSRLFGILMAICAVLGFCEFFQVKFNKETKLNYIKVIGIISILLITLNNCFYKIDNNVCILIPLFGLTLPIIFYNNNKLYNIVDALYVLGIVYFLGLSFQNIILIRSISMARCIFIFIISFMTDTYAYLGGMLVGRHKLTSISPKKTVEGSLIGGCVGTVIGSVYYYNVVGGVTVFESVMLCIFLTLISEFGDLLFSSIKRNFDVKDYSNLIPGHGGILDRFDSVIYVSLGLSLILSLF